MAKAISLKAGMKNTEPGTIKNRFFDFPFFIPLMGLFPILSLLAANLGQTSFSSAWFSLIVSLAAVILISVICILTIHPRPRAYLASVILCVGFFTWGHFFHLVEGEQIFGFNVGRHVVIFPLFLIVIILLLILVIKAPSPSPSFVRTLNVVFSILCIVPLVSIIAYQAMVFKNQKPKPSVTANTIPNNPVAAENLPDIYYIILDGVVREDEMKTGFGFQDYSLPDELRKRGFYIPDCTFSNYHSTATSIASVLNMDYLDKFGVADDQINTDENDPGLLYPLLHQNRVVAYLRNMGYQFVAFRGFFPLNDFSDADVYINYFKNQAGTDDLSERNFRALFYSTTLLDLPQVLIREHLSKFPFLPRSVVEFLVPDSHVYSSRSYQWYQQHMYAFDQLGKIPSLPGAKFIYAHFYSTHQPYVLNSDGSLLWPINEDNNGYISGVKYTSTRILEDIDKILAESKVPPVIIIQADHGQDGALPTDHHKILNAIYLPETGRQLLYPTITPVNTFRVILNSIAGGSFQLLPDTLLLTKTGTRDFERVPASCEIP